jgi:hypothetical protein
MELCKVNGLECIKCQPCCGSRKSDDNDIDKQFNELLENNLILYNSYTKYKHGYVSEIDSLKLAIINLCQDNKELSNHLEKLMTTSVRQCYLTREQAEKVGVVSEEYLKQCKESSKIFK